MPDDPTNGEMPQPTETTAQEATTGATPDFATWLDSQPEEVKTLISRKVDALHSDLHRERQQHKEFTRQIRELSASAAEGSEAKKLAAEMVSKLEQAEQRASFYEEAGRAEIACSNPRAAFLVASAEGLFTKRGDPDWPAIKAAAPELFGRKTTPPGNAGSGNGSPPASPSMNDYIRAASGRR